MKDPEINDIEKELMTPKDWNKMNNKDRASVLVLSFIGYCARPKNIPKDVLEKCVEAFNSHRGKVEWEEQAILEVLNGREK